VRRFSTRASSAAGWRFASRSGRSSRLPRLRRARLPARPLLRSPPHDHLARARPRAQGAARATGRARGRAAPARPLRRPDPGMSTSAELAFLFRALKASAAARALPGSPNERGPRNGRTSASPRRCCRPRSPPATPTAARHGSSRPASPPARRSRSSTSPSSARCRRRSSSTWGSSTSSPPATTSSCSARPAPARRTSRSRSRSAPASPATGFSSPPRPSRFARLADAQRAGRLAEELRRLERVPLLVVDEVGYIPFDPQAANLMFMLVSSRYGRASLIVTSNKPFSAWGEIFGDEVVAAAMIDRLVHQAEILSLKGDSYRLKDKDLGARPSRGSDPSPSGLRPDCRRRGRPPPSTKEEHPGRGDFSSGEGGPSRDRRQEVRVCELHGCHTRSASTSTLWRRDGCHLVRSH
jgi:IstB-like ATP binding protein